MHAKVSTLCIFKNYVFKTLELEEKYENFNNNPYTYKMQCL